MSRLSQSGHARQPAERRPPESVAIVIPSKNRRDDVLFCLQSVERQATQPDTIVVVDQSPVRYELPLLPRLVHIHAPTLTGLTAARNAGIHATNCDIVFFLDDDAELRSDCVRAICDAFRERPDAVGVQCLVTDAVGRRTARTRLGEVIFERGFFNSAPVMRRGNFTELRRAHGITAYRRELLDRELFDERLTGYCLGEDWEFSKRALKYGKLLQSDEALVFHNQSPVDRHQAQRVLWARWDNFLYFYDKLGADRQAMNRVWRLWWMFGESLKWVRNGCGFPLFGPRAVKPPGEPSGQSSYRR